MSSSRYAYYDLDLMKRSTGIETIFPGWGTTPEVVTVFSPHDDDAILGAGYLLSAARDLSADAQLCIFCDGRAGYSTLAEKDSIVDVRKRETIAAYALLGIAESHIMRLNIPDFSANQPVGWFLGGGEGTFRPLITWLRQTRTTRLLFPNAYREHLDHWGVGLTGLFYGPQVGDPILPDWGTPCAIKTHVEYAVWGDFAPDAPPDDSRRPHGIRANRCICAAPDVEQKIAAGLRAYRSQARIIEGLLSQRAARACREGCVEAYRVVNPRPALDYRPYAALIDSMNA